MPELPEVETVRAGLERYLRGVSFTSVRVNHPRAVRNCPGGARDLEALAGREIRGVARRGKFIWLGFSPDGEPGTDALVVHLGMSGQMIVRGQDLAPLREDKYVDSTITTPLMATRLPDTAVGQEPPSHARAVFNLDNGRVLHFIDQRTFGHLTPSSLQKTDDGKPAGRGSSQPLIPAALAGIARDGLDPNLDLDPVLARLAKSRAPIKAALLDQRNVSGIGNIYADEALWQARINPAAPARSLDGGRVRELYECAADVMSRALEVGGTSFDSLYVNVHGAPGYFAQQLNAYGRRGKPCARCETVMVGDTVAGRGSTWCPRCQSSGA